MSSLILVLCVMGATLFGLTGGYMASQKGRSPEEGVLFGFLLGPLGVFVEAMLPVHQKGA